MEGINLVRREREMEKWANQSDQQWENVFKKDGEIEIPNAYKNAQALMSFYLGRPADPLNINDITEFNKDIKTLKNVKSELNSIQTLQVSLPEAKDREKTIGKIHFNDNFKITDNKNKDYEMQISSEQNEGSLSFKITPKGEQTTLGDFNLDFKQHEISLNSSEFALKNFTEQNSKEGFYTLTLYKTQNESTETLTAAQNDIIHNIWTNIISYKTWITKKRQREIEDQAKEKLSTKVKEVTEKTINNNDREIIVNIESRSILTQWWFTEEIDNKVFGMNYLKKLLKNSKFNEYYIRIFLDYFYKDIIKKNDDNTFGILTEKYGQNFGGAIGEVETKAYALYKAKIKGKKTRIKVTITGQETDQRGKSVPADGNIKFKYKDKKYICTFQSKFYAYNTLIKSLYADTRFYLGQKATESQKNTTLYAYSQKLINEYPLNNVVNLDCDLYLKPDYYKGAVPGLLRINTFLTDVKRELRTCDIYYISGVFVPSVYLLKQIKDLSVDKNNNNKPLIRTKGLLNTKKQKEGYYNVVQGSLNIPNTLDLLEGLINFDIK